MYQSFLTKLLKKLSRIYFDNTYTNKGKNSNKDAKILAWFDVND